MKRKVFILLLIGVCLMSLHDLAGMTTTTTGTGTLTLVEAIDGLNSFDDAGVTNGETVQYCITTYSLTTHRPVDRELVSGVYTTSTKALTRATVIASTNGGSKINLTGLSDVCIMISKDDITAASGGFSFSSYYQNTAHNITDGTNNGVLEVDTEAVDADNISSVAADVVTVAASGWYDVSINVTILGGGNMNGDLYMEADIGGYTYFTHKAYITADAVDEDVLYLGPHRVELTASDTINATLSNHTGVTVLCQINEINITKLS